MLCLKFLRLYIHYNGVWCVITIALLEGNCIFFSIFLFIHFLIDVGPYSLEKKELVLLVALYESYGQLKTHTAPTHINTHYDVM